MIGSSNYTPHGSALPATKNFRRVRPVTADQQLPPWIEQWLLTQRITWYPSRGPSGDAGAVVDELRRISKAEREAFVYDNALNPPPGHEADSLIPEHGLQNRIVPPEDISHDEHLPPNSEERLSPTQSCPKHPHARHRLESCPEGRFGNHPGDMGELMAHEERERLWNSYGDDGPRATP